MNFVLFAVTAVFHLVIPVALASWIRSRRITSRAEWVGVLAVLCVYVAVIVPSGGGWSLLGFDTRQVLLGVLTTLVLGSAPRLRHLPAFRRPGKGKLALYACAALLLAISIPGLTPAWTRHQYEGAPVTLAFPPRDGKYAVINGGGNVVVNPHAAIHGQRYAIDITKLGFLGMRASGILPADLHRYAVYGDVVHAPCAGSVVFREDGLPEQRPPSMNPGHLAGNHVALRCEDGSDVSLLLAHLAPGSVRVQTGDTVRVGDPLGRAGNSGNTSEPHLHLQAIRGEAHDIDAFMTGDPVAMLFDGRFLARNGILTVDDAKPL